MENQEEVVELIKPDSKKKIKKDAKLRDNYNKYKKYISPIIMILIGLLLCTNSDNVIIYGLYIIGAIIIGFGMYHLYNYIQLKNQLKITDEKKLTTAIICLGVGIVIVILATIIKTFINTLIGIWLILIAFDKTRNISELSKTDRRTARLNIIESIILLLMAIYTIFFQNIILTAVGIWLIISAGIELFNILKK